jgi:Zn-dependent metalloprotease
MRGTLTSIIALLSIVLATNLVADDEAVAAATPIAMRAAEQFLQQKGEGDAVFRGLFVDSLGQAHVRYDQTYKNVPVFAGQMIVHVGLSDETVIGVTDARHRVGSVDMTPTIRARAAATMVRKAEGLRGQLSAATELVVYVAAETTSLAWRVNLVGSDVRRLPVDWVALVDAHNGELLLSFDNLHTKRDDPPRPDDDDEGSGGGDGVAAIGQADTLYFGTVALPTELYDDGSFGMLDPSRGGNYTTDMLDKRVGEGELFVDEDNIWGDFTNLDRATAAADAHFSASVTWDYYLTVHGP